MVNGQIFIIVENYEPFGELVVVVMNNEQHTNLTKWKTKLKIKLNVDHEQC